MESGPFVLPIMTNFSFGLTKAVQTRAPLSLSEDKNRKLEIWRSFDLLGNREVDYAAQAPSLLTWDMLYTLIFPEEKARISGFRLCHIKEPTRYNLSMTNIKAK